MFVVVRGECRVCEGEVLVGSGRWKFSEWDGEVWESSGGCGAGFAVKKGALKS